MSIRRLAATAAAGAVLGLGLLLPAAGHAATPMPNGCHLMAPSTVSCRYVAGGNGRYMSTTSSSWVITVMHQGRVRLVANNPNSTSRSTTKMGTFTASPGDVVTVRFDAMVPAGWLDASDL